MFPAPERFVRHLRGTVGPVSMAPFFLALVAVSAMGHAAVSAAECESAFAPTPLSVPVTSVPIVVPSTAGDYFVLYVSHGERTLPVSVTRGREGATPLAWPVEGLPPGRYRVEKYPISEPGDVDGDCIDDLTDPNPVNPAGEIAFTDGLTLLSSSAQWRAIAFDALRDGCSMCEVPGSGTDWLKLSVDRRNPVRPGVYFINAPTHWGHPHFAFALGLPLDLISLELDRATGLPGFAPDSTTYFFWFSNPADALDLAGMVPLLHSAIGASMPIMRAEAAESRLAYYVPDTVWNRRYFEAISPWLPSYEEAGIRVLVDGSFVDDAPEGACESDETRRCLRDSRFAVEVEWTGPGGTAGAARVVHAGTNDSALFSFFDRANWEVLAKVLDGCAVNGSFWVFAASTTDLEFTIRVTDTATGVSRAYSNEAGAAAPAVADTEAFPGACGNGRGR